MKQSNTVALPGLGQPLAFPYRVGRVAPVNLTLPLHRPPRVSKGEPSQWMGRCSPRRDWAPQIGTHCGGWICAFPVALGNLPPP